MSYLMIRNPGVADHRCFTLLGVSTTRDAGVAGTIGQFGSGIKNAVAVLLRHKIPVWTCPGRLKMEFSEKEIEIHGRIFHQVHVQYSGFTIDGKSKNDSENLGAVTEWGTNDWTKPAQGFREIVANGIDGATLAGGSYEGVEFEVVEKVRAKAGYTSVYLEWNDETERIFGQLGTMFLHYGKPECLKDKCLPKRNPGEDKILIYKKGVLVSFILGKSVFDYNLGEELRLDESRNAHDWDVRYAVAKALRDVTSDKLVTILKEIIKTPDLWEAKLDASYLGNDTYAKPEVQTKRKGAFQEAWGAVAGPKGVITSGSVALSSFVEEKGFTPVHVEDGWAKALESYEVLSESKVLTANELTGKILSPATQEMLDCTKKVWSLFEVYNLTNGKPMPGVQGFMSVMDGSTQTKGYYLPGGTDIYLLNTLGAGKMMFKVTLEECTHYATGSDDKSRDIQDILFNLITEMTF